VIAQRGIGMRERIIVTGTTFGHTTVIGDTQIATARSDEIDAAVLTSPRKRGEVK